MKKSNSINRKQLLSLCEKNSDALYVSKSGIAYIESLKKLFKFNNKNDIPFTTDDVIRQPELKDFNFSGIDDFVPACTLKGEPLIIDGDYIRNERIIVDRYEDNNMETIMRTTMGVCYLMTMTIYGREHIIKFGSTRTPFLKRLGSYNCGTVKARFKGTCSSTNFKILQSFITTRKDVSLYIWISDESALTYNFHGVISVPFASQKVLAIEDIMIKQFKTQFGHRPLANIQSNATEIN